MKPLSLFFFLLISSFPLLAESSYDFVDALYRKPNSDLHYPTKAALKLYGSDLQALIQKAIDIRADYEHKHPGDKPPFADYSLLSPSADGYQSYKIFTAKPEEARDCLVIVQLFQDPKDKVEPDFVYLDLQTGKAGWTIKRIRYQSYRYDLKKFETSNLEETLRRDIKDLK